MAYVLRFQKRVQTSCTESPCFVGAWTWPWGEGKRGDWITPQSSLLLSKASYGPLGPSNAWTLETESEVLLRYRLLSFYKEYGTTIFSLNPQP